jgi:hypothetical protein
MQKLLMTLALTVSTSSLIACKDKDPNAERAEKAAENLNESREDLTKAAGKVAEEQKDVVEESKDVAKEAKDVAQARNDLAAQQMATAEARGEFIRASQVQLEGIQQRLKDAETRWGAKGKEKIVVLRTQIVDIQKIRDEAQANSSADMNATKQRWDAAVKRFEEDYEQTRKDIESR